MTSFEDFVAGHGQRLFRTALLVSGSRSDAEEAVQEVLLRAFERWDRVEAAKSPEAYVRRMVLNEITSRWRRTRGREVLDANPGRVEDTTVEGVEPDAALAVWRACLALPVRQRSAVVLRFYEDLSYEEIAQTLGCSQTAARIRVSRGVARMRDLLGEEES